jgi:nicotinate-nucleotide adenylyltransferase
MSRRRIGILGGTFDPIHLGHTGVARAACQAIDPMRLVIIPANITPHRPQPIASSFHRFAMAALVVGEHPGWSVSDQELRIEEASYTSLTLKRFLARGYRPTELFFLLGADAFAEIGTWNDYPGILDAAHFVVVSRPGAPVDELPRRLPALAARMVASPLTEAVERTPSVILIDADTPDVSSTAIRRNRAEGRSVAGLVDRTVQQHIEQHGLYGAAVPGRRRSDESAGS